MIKLNNKTGGNKMSKKTEPSMSKILETVILGALETKINKKENKALVFICCGKPRKNIENRGLCPHCLEENTEVVNLWKFNLAKEIANLTKQEG